MTVHETAERGFQRAAGAYERGRPDYEPALVDWLIDRAALEPGRVIVDVGAGTGKLTRALLASGAEVVAVEPVAGMRAVLEREVSVARVMAATAEQLPLGDSSADAIVVAQAFHWFDGPRALAEFHRVTRQGGRLLLVWNTRRTEQPLWRAVDELIGPYRGDTPSQGSGCWRVALEDDDHFALIEELRTEFDQAADAEALVDRVTSTSFIAALPTREREALVDRLRAVAVAAPQPLSLGYRTEAFAYERL